MERLYLASVVLIVLLGKFVASETSTLYVTKAWAAACQSCILQLKLLIVLHDSVKLSLRSLQIVELLNQIRAYRQLQLIGVFEHLDEPVAILI